MNNPLSRSDIFLRVIGIFKIVKALVFWAAAIGMLHFLHRDVEAWLMQVLDNSHVDSDNRAARWLLKQSAKLTSVRIGEISAVCFFYGCLFATEGVGLYLRKKWAEYFVVIITGSLLPIEIYELAHKFNWAKLVLVAVNLIILVFLIVVVSKKKK
jgi:uncharacterized membrane protein (DUF2068 family)